MLMIRSELSRQWLIWLAKMANLSFQHVLLSLFVTSGGTIGGWVLTAKFAGEKAALSFLQIGLTAVMVIACTQTIFFLLGKKRLIYRILFNVSFALGIVWFMLCMLLPVLWVQSLTNGSKIALFLFLFILCADNILAARSQFESKWKKGGKHFLNKYYDENCRAIDWSEILTEMKFSISLQVWGVPKSLYPAISFISVFSMVAGLSFRNVYPTFSFFAWGIPSCLVISIFVQMIGLGIAQFLKVSFLEKQYGVPIALNDAKE